MSSFTMLLLEDGVEVDLPADLSEVLSLLEREVPGFSCEGYSYQLAGVTRAHLGNSWGLLAKLADPATGEVMDVPVGRIELEKVDDRLVKLRVPPRSEEEDPAVSEFDPNGRYFGSLIYQMLNCLHRHQLIDLPGMLPLE